MRVLVSIFLFITISGTATAQEQYRGSIPMHLLRPGMGGEAPRYPLDTVIGELGQGEASDAAYSFATWVAGGLLSGRMNHPALESVNPLIREEYLQTIREAEPRFYRMGSGREEHDGSTSFLIRFIGKELAVTGEMYVRHATIRINEPETPAESTEAVSDEEIIAEPEEEPADKPAAAETQAEPASETIAESADDPSGNPVEDVSAKVIATIATTNTWVLEDLLLDEVKDREREKKETMNRIDYVPYERFF